MSPDASECHPVALFKIVRTPLRRRKIACRSGCAMTLVILLVDDERAMREFLAQALEENGYRVLQAVNGREALKVISDAAYEGPNLILSDVMMPLLGGVELCRAVKSNPETAKTPVILMSAAASKGDSVGAHADAFINKPFDLHALDVLIDSIL